MPLLAALARRGFSASALGTGRSIGKAVLRLKESVEPHFP
jgi:hypothetical protein